MTSQLDIPKEWTFKNADVAHHFDDHVREQLPWYDIVTHGIAHIARHYIPEGGLVYDVGASTGNIGRALAPILESRKATLYGIENSPEMCAKYKAPGKVFCHNAVTFTYEPFDFAVCYLVLMFVPFSQRRALLQRLRQSLNPGGCIVIVDKCVALEGYVATVMSRLTLHGKVINGASYQHIVEKELSLAGVQRPIEPEIVGSDAVQWFQYGEFAGWLITG